MTATAVMIAEVRRLVNEPDDTNGYDDTLLGSIIERYPLIDERGEEPYTFDTSTTPPSPDANEDWIATYDLHLAAAAIWEEKAAPYAGNYDFKADGGDYKRSQQFDQYMGMARFHNARRKPRSIRAFQWPNENKANLEDLTN